MEENKDIKETKITDGVAKEDRDKQFLQDYKAFTEEWRVKLQEIESTLSKDLPENLEEINSLKEAIDTLQSSDSLFEDFLSFYHKLTCSSFFLKYNCIKQKNQSEFIRNKEQVIEVIRKCCNIHKLLRSNTSIEELELLFNCLLSYAKDLDPILVEISLNSILKDLEAFDLLEVSTNRNKEDLKRVKIILIDFIYQFKDKRPRLKENGVLDIFNIVMEFVCKHRFKPSPDLQEKYSKTKLNRLLQFPSFEFLKTEIDMDEDVYEELKKVYDKIGHFNYFFDTDLPLKKVYVEEDDFAGVEICHRTEDTNQCYGAGINIFSDGQVFQGYFKDGERYFDGRVFWPDGETHIASFNDGYKTGYLETVKIPICDYKGTCVEGKYNGKGIYKFSSNDLVCSEFTIGDFHGPAIHYSDEGVKLEMYQSDELI